MPAPTTAVQRLRSNWSIGQEEILCLGHNWPKETNITASVRFVSGHTAMSIVRLMSRCNPRQRSVHRCVISIIGFNENTFTRSSSDRWQIKFSLQRRSVLFRLCRRRSTSRFYIDSKSVKQSGQGQDQVGPSPPPVCFGRIVGMLSSSPLRNTKGTSPNRRKPIVAAIHRTFIFRISLRHQDEVCGRTSVHVFLTNCINNPHTSLQCGCRRSVGESFAGDVD